MDNRLHRACEHGDLEEVISLVEQGADVHALDSYLARTPLHCSMGNGHLLLYRFLIASGADVNTKDTDGFTPLHSACVWDRAETVELLIAKGADIHALDDKSQTPLHVVDCANEGKQSIVRMLLKEGADAYAKSKYGTRPVGSIQFDQPVRRLLIRTQPLVILLARADIPTDLIRELALYV